MKSIKAKLVAGISLFVLLSIAMVASTLITVEKQKNDSQIISAAGKQRMLSQKMMKEFNTFFSDNGEDEKVLELKETTLKETIRLFDTTLMGLIEGNKELGLPAAENVEIETQLLVVKDLWSQFVSTFNRGFEEGFFEEEETFLSKNNIPLLNEMSEAVRLISKASSDKVSLMESMQYIFLIITIIVGAAVFIFAKMTIIQKLEQMAAKVSDITSNYNLTDRLEVSQNEIGKLAAGFNFFLDEFQALLRNVAQSTESVNRSTIELAETSRKMESDAIQQQQQTEQVATAIDEMSATSLEVARNSKSASEFAAEASQLATEGGEIVTQTIDGINRIAATVEDSSRIISTLGESSKKIGQIVSVIEDIAAQTNLLALNAAIEAARAGEQGRGFAVVADEVRSLAQRTSDATSEIASMIGSIQADTTSAVTAMENGTVQVTQGVELANQAGTSLGRIVEVASNVTDMARQIATAADEQSAVAGDLSQNISSVAEITRTTAQASQHSSERNQQLTQQVTELQQEISVFKL